MHYSWVVNGERRSGMVHFGALGLGHLDLTYDFDLGIGFG